jgi:hypothetical protein
MAAAADVRTVSVMIDINAVDACVTQDFAWRPGGMV